MHEQGNPFPGFSNVGRGAPAQFEAPPARHYQFRLAKSGYHPHVFLTLPIVPPIFHAPIMP
jgi:hypothetical protein